MPTFAGVYLVDLPPLFSGFLGKAFVYHWHDFIQQLTKRDKLGLSKLTSISLAVGRIGDFLHQRRRCPPRFVIGSFPDLHWLFISQDPLKVRLRCVPWIPSRYNSSQLQNHLSVTDGTMGVCLVGEVDRITILNLSYACLQVVQGQVADLIFQTVEIHSDVFVLSRYSDIAGQRKEGDKKCPLPTPMLCDQLTSQNKRRV